MLDIVPFLFYKSEFHLWAGRPRTPYLNQAVLEHLPSSAFYVLDLKVGTTLNPLLFTPYPN